MSLRTISCIEVRCDGCGLDCWDQLYDGIPHWSSEDKARKELAASGWRLMGDRLLCGRCGAAEDCDRNGHLWSSWQPSYTDPTVEYRYCTHCTGADEERFAEQAYGGRL